MRLTKASLFSAFLAAALALLPESALPIGRSGNGFVASAPDGFQAKAPDFFDVAQALPAEGLRLIAPNIRTSGLGSAPVIELRRFIAEYPQEAAYTRDQQRANFAAHGWWLANHSNPCVEVFLSDNDSASVAIATWGEGKGVVIIGQKTGLTKSSIKQMLDSLTLDAGACAWK